MIDYKAEYEKICQVYTREGVLAFLATRWPDLSNVILHKDRNGDWIDQYGACKVCDGEIPYGHRENCDIYNLEQQAYNLKQIEKAAIEWRTKYRATSSEMMYQDDDCQIYALELIEKLLDIVGYYQYPNET